MLDQVALCSSLVPTSAVSLNMDSGEASSPSSSTSSATKKTLKQACDNCRRRKIKCNRAHPCDKCQRLLLSCSYSDVLQRKGPKFRTLYPLAPLHPLVSHHPTPPSVDYTGPRAQSQFSGECDTQLQIISGFVKSSFRLTRDWSRWPSGVDSMESEI
jgi:hypothetical protein